MLKLIFAGNRNEYRRYLKETGKTFLTARFVKGATMLQGRTWSETELILYGTWQDRLAKMSDMFIAEFNAAVLSYATGIIWRMFQGRCVHCNRQGVAVHEIEPRGMSNDPDALREDNRVVLCAECHEAAQRHEIDAEILLRDREKALERFGNV